MACLMRPPTLKMPSCSNPVIYIYEDLNWTRYKIFNNIRITIQTIYLVSQCLLAPSSDHTICPDIPRSCQQLFTVPNVEAGCGRVFMVTECVLLLFSPSGIVTGTAAASQHCHKTHVHHQPHFLCIQTLNTIFSQIDISISMYRRGHIHW